MKAKERWQICAMVACLLDGQLSLQEIHNSLWKLIKVHHKEILEKRDPSVLLDSKEYQDALVKEKVPNGTGSKVETPREKINVCLWLIGKFHDPDEAVEFVKKARTLV